MKNIHRSIPALLGLLLAVLVLSRESRPQERGEKLQFLDGKAKKAFLKRVEKSMAKVQSLVAEFEQDKVLSLFDDKVRTHGVILFARPDHLRWEIQKPFRSILVVSGNQVGKFEYAKGKRRTLKLGRSGDIILMVMDQIRGWFRGQFEKSTKIYEVRLAEKPSPAIVFVPKDKELGKSLLSIELRLAKDLSSVERVTIRERGGDYTMMRFVHRRRNTEIPRSYFSVKDPSELDLNKLPSKPIPVQTPKGRQKSG